MSLHMHDLDFADTIIGTNMFMVRQGGSAGEDRQATLDSLKVFMLSDTTQLDIISPLTEIDGSVNITGSLTIDGTPIIDYVSTDHHHDDIYFTQTYLTAALGARAPLLHTHEDLYYSHDESLSTVEINQKFDDFEVYFTNNLPVHDHNTQYYQQSEVDQKIDDVSLEDGGMIDGNLEITGDLTIQGTSTTINTQTVEIEDNIIEINSNQIGTPSLTLKGGLEINRGSDTNYQLVFVEADQNFQIGTTNTLQPVATRQDSPLDEGYAKWNNDQKRFDTESFHVLFSQIFPTGFIYTQYPGKPSPSDFGWPGTWIIISGSGKEYDGVFFRAEGANANSFSSGVTQEDAIIYHTHNTYIGGHRHQYEYADGYTGGGALTTGDYDGTTQYANEIGWYDYGTKTSYNQNSTNQYSNTVESAHETRPINKTVRIWERIS